MTSVSVLGGSLILSMKHLRRGRLVVQPDLFLPAVQYAGARGRWMVRYWDTGILEHMHGIADEGER